MGKLGTDYNLCCASESGKDVLIFTMITKDNLVRTTIVVDTNTREKLKKFGSKGETYEEIILKLIESYEDRLTQSLIEKIV